MPLPDFSSEENAVRLRSQRVYDPYLLSLCESVPDYLSLGGAERPSVLPNQSKTSNETDNREVGKRSNKTVFKIFPEPGRNEEPRTTRSEQEELLESLQNVIESLASNSLDFQSRKRPVNQDILSTMVQFWLRNEEKIEILDINPTKFFDLLEDFDYTFSARSWKTRLDLTRFFCHKKQMPARLNDLFEKGFTIPDAERYLFWQAGDIREMGPVKASLIHEFTKQQDIDLLLYVCKQNGLHKAASHTDWYADKSGEIQYISPGNLELRFRTQFEYQFSKFPNFLPKQVVEEQEKLYYKYRVNWFKTDTYNIPIEDILKALDTELVSCQDPTDFLVWIRVSEKVSRATNVCLVRLCTRVFLETKNPLKYQRFKPFCTPDSEFEAEVCNRFSDVSRQIAEFAKATIENRPFEQIADFQVSNVGLRSLKKVVSYLLGDKKQKDQWDCVDAVIYEVLKFWAQKKNLKNRPRIYFQAFMDKYFATPKQFLNPEEINDELTDDEGLTIYGADDIEEPVTVKIQDTFGKRFVRRKFDNHEWMKIVKVLVETQYTRHLLDETHVQSMSEWKEVLERAQIISERPIKDVQRDFFKIVEPNISSYLEDHIPEHLFREIWSSKPTDQ